MLNGGAADGAAEANAQALQALGFTIGAVGVADDTRAATTIRYADGQQSQAKTLAAQVPGARLVKTDAVDTVTLILGTNGVQASTLMTAPDPAPPASDVPDSTDLRTGDDSSCID